MSEKITSSALSSEAVSSGKEAVVMSSGARGTIRVIKTSYFDPPVTGAGYGVYYDEACCNAAAALWIGRENANSDKVENLALGTYYVKEFSAPTGYTLDETVYTVNLTADGQVAVVNSFEPTTAVHGNIKVVKKTYFNEPVTGTGFGIYRDAACSNAVDALWIGLLDADSDISVDLPLGTYYVKEISTLSGNCTDENIYTITIANDGAVPVSGAGYGIYRDSACQQPMDALWIGLEDSICMQATFRMWPIV